MIVDLYYLCRLGVCSRYRQLQDVKDGFQNFSKLNEMCTDDTAASNRVPTS